VKGIEVKKIIEIENGENAKKKGEREIFGTMKKIAVIFQCLINIVRISNYNVDFQVIVDNYALTVIN
jgi:hypothetical protein